MGIGGRWGWRLWCAEERGPLARGREGAGNGRGSCISQGSMPQHPYALSKEDVIPGEGSFYSSICRNACPYREAEENPEI